MYRAYSGGAADAGHTSKLVFFLNGKKIVDPQPDPDVTLLHYLRDKLRLRGTKLACGEGACGACTVMVSHYDRTCKKTVHKAVTSCLTPVCSLHGCAVTTVEGVGSIRSGLHPIQDRLVENHGIQCGFCTPGMVMSMYALLRTNANPSKNEIETALDGNLCRCTGYRPILQSFQSFSKEFTCGLGDKCCKNGKKGEEKHTESDQKLAEKFLPYDASQEPIFPSELQVSDIYDTANLRYEGQDVIWYRPASLPAFVALRKAYPSARLVGGFTGERACDTKADGKRVLIYVNGLEEMHVKEQTTAGLKLGAGLTVNEAARAVRAAIGTKSDHTVRGFAAVLTLLDRFASNQIRNMATLGGSIVANYPNSDVIVPLIAAGAQLTMANKDGRMQEIPLQSWCSSGKFVPCTNGGIVLAISIPCTPQDHHVFTFKSAGRRAMSRAIVNAGLSVTLESKTTKIKKVMLCFGGLAPSGVIVATKSMQAVPGKHINETPFLDVSELLKTELLAVIGPDEKEYRCSLAFGFLMKFYYQVNQECQGKDADCALAVGDLSCCVRKPCSSAQVYEEVPPDQPPTDDVGRPKVHVAAKQLATGEAQYYSDIPKREDELFLAVVRSTKPNAEILGVDPSSALCMPGVVGYVGHEDVPGKNDGFGMVKDEIIFAVDKVEVVGQAIGGIVAGTEQEARTAAAAVKVTYREHPPIMTIEAAIAKKSFYPSLEFEDGRGDTAKGFEEADHVKEGTVRIGAQEHFYMETQFSYVVPLKEAEEYEIFVCTQNLTGAQETVSRALGVPRSKILCRQKRIGGAFGGKESRPPSLALLPAAVAAHKFQRPIRCQLTRAEDMAITGGRHPYIIKYKAGFKEDGEITAMEYNLYHNGGSVVDASMYVGYYSVWGSEGAYRIPNIRSHVQSCKTNTSSPTAMRGYGRPQVLFSSEAVVTSIAETLAVYPEKVRDRNLLSDGDPTMYGMPVTGNLRKCWDQLNVQCDVKAIRQQNEDFNVKNRFKKRGVAIIPTLFGIGFPMPTIWQAGALLMAYLDGSVLLTHGGVEMGQGINTKMVQIASRELGISSDRIHIAEASTNTVPNATTTGGSTGTDLNGAAVMDACRQLKERLAPIVKSNPKGSWDEWVGAAYGAQIGLSVSGHYMLRKEDYPANEWKNCLYYTYGASCTVVELDALTGEHAILETDIVMDVGRSVNPGIDIGQIEGAFLQGRGYHTMEEVIYSDDGHMTTQGAGSYKISTVADIPIKFNVTLLKGGEEKWKRPVYSSKGIGEPPLALGMSVYFAIKDAIGAVRKDNGLTGPFDLDSPATVERIRMACCDKITKLVTGKDGECKPGWRA